ncbi:MAG: hypothetical protein H6492_01060 [Candidatus Paracaedibacteraceae bacterium]|nr:hypothetical protein [Candidatus Paracaedibacteraceae bacterium]
MKKLILSSVFAGLVLASGVEASTAAAPQKAPYGAFVINADFAAGYWANLYHKTPDGLKDDSIDTDDWMKRGLVALSDSKMTFKTEGGCSAVAFGATVKLDVNAAAKDFTGLLRDTYVFGRFGNMIEVRIGSQRDAMWSMVDADSLMGGTYGYNGYYGNLLKSTTSAGQTRKERFILDLTHKNDTWYTNALEVRTVRMAGLQAILNWKPSAAYKGRLGTYGDGQRIAGVANNILSASVNYDNTFGDFRVRVSAAGVYEASDRTDAKGVKIADQNENFTYRLGSAFSWKSFDIGFGWADDCSTGFAAGNNKDGNAGKKIHGVVGLQFDNTMWKPRISVGALYGWKNGKDSTIKNNDTTLAVSGALDLNIREGFRWFVEGTWAGLDYNNLTEVSDKGLSEPNFILGTGLAVSQ